MNFNYMTHNREPFFELARKRIQPDSVVLDVGPGEGSFAEFCGRDDFYFFEGNSSTVKILKQKFSQVYEGVLPQMPFEANFFDVIHCSHVVEHLSPDVFYQTLVSFDRCLKVGGYLIISAPLLWQGFYDDLSHIRPYPPLVFKNYLCKNAGESRTRTIISNSYLMEEEVYRFRKINPFQDCIPKQGSIFSKFVTKALSFLGKRFITKLEKTGYTVVLKKQ